MKPIGRWSSGVAACALLAGAAGAQYTADFEAPAYTLGPLEGQGIWTNWSGTNGSSTLVVNTQNHTSGGAQSIEITNGADTVADFDALAGGSFDSGQWTLSLQSLCPTGGTGVVYVLAMNQWQVTGGPYEWNVQLGLNSSTGKARLFTPDGVKEVPLVYGAWTEVRCEYDLDANVVTVFYDNTLIWTYDPRCGVTPGCGGAYSGSFLDALDLYPDPATNPSVIFFDDLVVEQTGGGPPGVKFCFGDGSGTPCPCGNTGGTGQGCANSTGMGGVLDGTGSDSVAADDLVLTATNAIPNQPGLFFQALNAINGGDGQVFGDGLRCAGGSVVRLGVGVPNGSGCIASDGSCGNLPNGPIDIAAEGGVVPGDVRRYQFWYRNPSGGPCGAGFNLGNGYEVGWTN